MHTIAHVEHACPRASNSCNSCNSSTSQARVFYPIRIYFTIHGVQNPICSTRLKCRVAGPSPHHLLEGIGERQLYRRYIVSWKLKTLLIYPLYI